MTSDPLDAVFGEGGAGFASSQPPREEPPDRLAVACAEAGLDHELAQALGISWAADSRDLKWTTRKFKSRGYAGFLGTRHDGRRWFAPWPPDIDAGVAVEGPKGGLDLLPGSTDQEVHVTGDPVAAAVLRDRGEPSVGWINGPNGWRGPKRRLHPDIADRSSRTRVVLHPPAVMDIKAWSSWESFASHAHNSGLDVSVNGTAWKQFFAPKNRPRSDAQRRADAEKERLAGVRPKSPSKVPRAVIRARAVPSQGLFDRGRFLADIAARCVLDCMDGDGLAIGPGGLWVYDDGVWMPGWATNGNGGAVQQVIVAILGDEFRIGLAKTIIEILGATPELPRITGHPIGDGWGRTLNFGNGVYDLDTRSMSAHLPSCLSTWRLPSDYDPDAECPWFREVLAEILPADMLVERDGVAPWQEDLGYFLLPGNPFHMAFLLRGGGRNGKGVYMTVIEEMVGRDAMSALSLEDLVSGDRNRFRLIRLVGSAVNICGEVDPKYVASTATFKQLTGGDPVAMEVKHGPTFDYPVWATMVFSANQDFAAVDRSVAYFDRWQVRSFPNYIPEGKRIENLGRLVAQKEMAGITAAAVAGLHRLLERGRFLAVDSSETQKATFRKSSDHILRFADEHLLFDAGVTSTRAEVWTAYSAFTGAEAVRPLPASKVYDALVAIGSERGIEVAERKVMGVRGFAGLKVGGAS